MSLSIIAFLFPMFLFTCGNSKTETITTGSYTPTIMQDAMVFQMKGFTLLFGGGEMSSKATTDDMMYYLTIGMVWLILLSAIIGLVVSFFVEKNQSKQNLSLSFSYTGLFGLLAAFYLLLAQGVSKGKIEDGDSLEKLASSLSEFSVGLGTGYYLCFLGFTGVIVYYKYLINKFKLVRIDVSGSLNTEEEDI